MSKNQNYEVSDLLYELSTLVDNVTFDNVNVSKLQASRYLDQIEELLQDKFNTKSKGIDYDTIKRPRKRTCKRYSTKI